MTNADAVLPNAQAASAAAPPAMVDIGVFGLFPEANSNCAAVHFGNAKTVRQPIGLTSANIHATLPIDDLCAIEIEIAPRGNTVYVRALLDVEGGDFVERQRWPTAFAGTQPLTSPVRWRGDLPKRLLAPLRYRLLVAAAPETLSWLSDAMIRGGGAGAGAAEFRRRDVGLIQREQVIRPF